MAPTGGLVCEGAVMAETRSPTTADELDPVVVLVVMGVTGTGKSTVAGILAGLLGWDLEEGDDLHPAANVAKMSAGQPLTDEDRWPWLDRVAAWIQDRVRTGAPGIITCSSLKRSYRDRLRGPGVVFVHLSGSREEILARLTRRLDHFMPASLLDSQLQTLEPLRPTSAASSSRSAGGRARRCSTCSTSCT